MPDPCVEILNPPCLTIYYTLDGTDPVPGNSGTFTQVHPFDQKLYMYKTTTLTFFARNDGTLDQGPTRVESYAIAQSSQVDTDGDGIPDAYEIQADGKARPGFDPLGTNRDTDGDGVADLVEILQGTDPFSTNLPGRWPGRRRDLRGQRGLLRRKSVHLHLHRRHDPRHSLRCRW